MSHLESRLNAALEGRYRIERELGQEGMATVYLAHDVRHERKVAVKVLHPELSPAAIVDPKTGATTVLPVGTDHDATAFWAPNGRIVVTGEGLDASMWRFRPGSSGGRR
jgi:hypothetical protein